jgi:hypothetical protein
MGSFFSSAHAFVSDLFSLSSSLSLCLPQFVHVGAEAPSGNAPLAEAKAEEVLEQDAHLRPACASIRTLKSNTPNPIFDLAVGGACVAWLSLFR